MLKLAYAVALSAAVLTVSQPVPAHAGKEMRAIKAAGLKGQYDQVRKQVKAQSKDGSGTWRTIKTAVGSGVLSGGATLLLNHFMFSKVALDNPQLLHQSAEVAVGAGLVFGALHAGGEVIHKIKKSFAISKEARRRVIASNNLDVR
jgi:hypothetical protein